LLVLFTRNDKTPKGYLARW